MRRARQAYSFTDSIREHAPLFFAGALGGALALLRFGTPVISPEDIS